MIRIGDHRIEGPVGGVDMGSDRVPCWFQTDRLAEPSPMGHAGRDQSSCNQQTDGGPNRGRPPETGIVLGTPAPTTAERMRASLAKHDS